MRIGLAPSRYGVIKREISLRRRPPPPRSALHPSLHVFLSIAESTSSGRSSRPLGPGISKRTTTDGRPRDISASHRGRRCLLTSYDLLRLCCSKVLRRGEIFRNEVTLQLRSNNKRVRMRVRSKSQPRDVLPGLRGSSCSFSSSRHAAGNVVRVLITVAFTKWFPFFHRKLRSRYVYI